MELETPIFELPFLDLTEATTAELVLAAQAGNTPGASLMDWK